MTIRRDNPSGDPLSAFRFEFRINGGSPRRLEFTTPQPDPQSSDSAYVLSGDSLDASVPLSVGSVSTRIVPTSTFIGGDSTFSGSDVLVTSSLLLARLEVTAATTLPPVLGDIFTISLEPTPNSFFFYRSLNPIAFRTQSGSVRVVPEPAIFALLSAGALVLCGFRRRWSYWKLAA